MLSVSTGDTIGSYDKQFTATFAAHWISLTVNYQYILKTVL